MDTSVSLKSLRSLRIQTLVVEDDAHFQQALVQSLAQRFLHDVTSVASADEAVIRLKKERYDLIISDF